MKPLSEDTTLEAERVWLDGLRAKSNLWRLRRTVELIEFCRRSALCAFERARPGASRRDRDEWWLTEAYGKELAAKVLAHCDRIGFHDR